jgi:hypothetical protein
MTNLDTAADKAVRDAVDAYMEGRLTPEFVGETVFETKNSRYRLLDGVVFAAPDDSLIGAELVGWLMETTRRSVIGSAWQPGSRAVLVDRQRGRNIIVTSTTRLLHLEQPSSAPHPLTVRREPGRAGPLPFSPQHAPIFAATPLPAPASVYPSTPLPPPAMPPGLQGPGQEAAILAQRRAAALHLPPRLIGPRAGTPVPIPPPTRPQSLPVPTPPPRREVPVFGHVNTEPRHVPDPPVTPRPDISGTPWELTSSEFELESESGDGDPDDVPTRYDASHYATPDGAEEGAPGSEPSVDAPIPLVRPIGPGKYGSR